MKENSLSKLTGALCLALLVWPNPGWAESVIATRAIRAGTILTADDVAAIPDSVPGTAQRPEEVIGQEARRNLYAGRAILNADLGPPTLVKRNSRVAMIYRIPGLALRTEGRALESGGAGETVQVMNLSSRTKVFATVLSADTVEVSR